jgi:hypothetical protein
MAFPSFPEATINGSRTSSHWQTTGTLLLSPEKHGARIEAICCVLFLLMLPTRARMNPYQPWGTTMRSTPKNGSESNLLAQKAWQSRTRRRPLPASRPYARRLPGPKKPRNRLLLIQKMPAPIPI